MDRWAGAPRGLEEKYLVARKAQQLARLHGEALAGAYQPELPIRRKSRAGEQCGGVDELASLTQALADAEVNFRKSSESVGRMLDLDPTSLPGGDLKSSSLDKLAGRFGAMAISSDRYAAWAQLERFHHEVEERGLGELTDRIRSGDLDVAAAVTKLRFARAESLWRVALEHSPALCGLSSTERHEIVTNFTSLERSRLKENVAGVLAGHLSQAP